MAEALYRKYRPRIFSDVVGQDTIERTLKNAISANKVSHAYLFCGPRGTGKTTTARLLAKALLCEEGPTPEPDGTCEDCVEIAEGRHPDVYELDAASRTGVDNVREEIIGRVSFAPVRGRYKIYIIDEVHMLSTAAFNALLKTLEEPPAHVIFVLCTTDPQKVPETILSRCQRFDFRRISVESIVSRLGAVCVAEGVEFEGEALDLIAHRADGGMRNALTSLEQLIAFGEGNVTIEGAERMLGSMDSSALAEIVTAIGKRDVAAAFRWTADFVESGADLAQFTRDIAQHVRDMYVIAIGADEAIDVSDAQRRLISGELEYFGPDRLARLLGVLGDLSRELKTSTNPRLSFEIALTRMVRPESDLTLAGLSERVERLEAALRDGRGRMRVAAGSPTTNLTAAQSAAEPMDFSDIGPGGIAVTAEVDEIDEGDEGDEAGGFDEAFKETSSATLESRFGAEDPRSVAASAAQTAETAAASESGRAAPIDAEKAADAAKAAAVSESEASLQRMWQAVIAKLKETKAAYGVLFANTVVRSVADDGAIVIEFPADNQFAFNAAQGSEVQAALAEALRSATGSSRAYRLMQMRGGNAPTGGAVAKASDASTGGIGAAVTGGINEAAATRSCQTVDAAQAAATTNSSRAIDSARAKWESGRAEDVSADDDVPLSVYEAEGYYYDGNDDDPAPKSQAPSPRPNALPQPEPATAAGADDPSQLDAWLAAGFGEGISFEEIPADDSSR